MIFAIKLIIAAIKIRINPKMERPLVEIVTPAIIVNIPRMYKTLAVIEKYLHLFNVIPMGIVATGLPQEGHVGALSEISLEQSGHFTSGINLPPFFYPIENLFFPIFKRFVGRAP